MPKKYQVLCVPGRSFRLEFNRHDEGLQIFSVSVSQSGKENRFSVNIDHDGLGTIIDYLTEPLDEILVPQSKTELTETWPTPPINWRDKEAGDF